MTTPNYGIATGVDLALSFAFAKDAVNKKKCQDPDIISEVCKDADNKTGCIKWKKNDSLRYWDPPSKISNVKCTSDKDCARTHGLPNCIQDEDKGKFCGYQPTDVEAGRCHVVDKELCLSRQELPYTCDENTCVTPKDAKAKEYTEWHEDAGTCDSGKDCDTDKDCPSNNSCIWDSSTRDGKGTCRTTGGSTDCQQGLQSACNDGTCSCTTDDNCEGASTCKDGKCQKAGRCIVGNFLLRQWCEEPQSRCKATDGKYPPGCKDSESSPGITDVPPFYYNQDNGMCYMTKDYCDRFGLDYSKTKKCTTTSDCDPGDNCFQNYCIGEGSECTETTGQKIGEMVLGKTIFRLFKTGKCEGYQHIPVGDMQKKTKEIPQAVSLTIPGDAKLALLKKDWYTEGIHMYIAYLGEESYTIACNPQEVKVKYPHLVNKDETEVTVTRDDVSKYPELKRLYLTLGSRDWASKMLSMFNRKM